MCVGSSRRLRFLRDLSIKTTIHKLQMMFARFYGSMEGLDSGTVLLPIDRENLQKNWSVEDRTRLPHCQIVIRSVV